jgi:hypothetical protein
LVGASGAVAASPYLWNVTQVKSLVDATTAFHGTAPPQLSTINSLTQIANGIQLDVTFNAGTQTTDPFGAGYGLTFARVSLAGSLPAALDLSGSSGTQWKITSDKALTAQDYLKTSWTETGAANVAGPDNDGDATFPEAFSFAFWEHNNAVSAGVPLNDFNSFSDGTTNVFTSGWDKPNPQAITVGTNNVQEMGVQLAGSGITPGQPVHAIITITGVPEPATLTLAGLASLGAIGFARRRK